jgi:hypothetical protein
VDGERALTHQARVLNWLRRAFVRLTGRSGFRQYGELRRGEIQALLAKDGLTNGLYLVSKSINFPGDHEVCVCVGGGGGVGVVGVVCVVVVVFALPLPLCLCRALSATRSLQSASTASRTTISSATVATAGERERERECVCVRESVCV